MITCPKHDRWTELPSGAKRDCPECPKRTVMRSVVGLCVDRMMLLTRAEADSYDRRRAHRPKL